MMVDIELEINQACNGFYFDLKTGTLNINSLTTFLIKFNSLYNIVDSDKILNEILQTDNIKQFLYCLMNEVNLDRIKIAYKEELLNIYNKYEKERRNTYYD